MRINILILSLVLICGCVGYRISHVHGTISGTNITTPYGPANGNLNYDATTCSGNCPSAEVLINANDIGSTNNTTK